MRTKWFKLLFLLLPLVWIINLLLPFLIKSLINKFLRNREQYFCRIEGLRLSLFPLVLTIKNIQLAEKNKEEKQSPFLTVKQIRIPLEWKPIWSEKIVCDIIVSTIYFSVDKIVKKEKKEPEEKKAPQKIHTPFFPLNIKLLTIQNSSIEFIDLLSEPQVHIQATEINMVGKYLNFMPKNNSPLAEIKIKGIFYGGTLNIDLRVNLLQKSPAFDMNAEVKKMNMTQMNDLFEAYGKFNVKNGTMGLYSEIAVKNGKFKGYVKPLIQNLKVVGKGNHQEGLLHLLWEILIGTITNLFENKEKKQVASKIPFEGEFDDPKIKILTAIYEVIRNAFVIALKPSIDYEINFNSPDEIKPK